MGLFFVPRATNLGGGAAIQRHLVRGEVADIAPQLEPPGAAAVAEDIHAGIDQRHRPPRTVVEAVRRAIERVEDEPVRDDHDLAAVMPAGDLGEAPDAALREAARAFSSWHRVVGVAAREAGVLLGIAPEDRK